MYEWDICAFLVNTLYIEVFVRAVHNPQSPISFYIFINDVLPNCMVSEFVWKPGVKNGSL